MATNRIHCVVVWNEPARNETTELWGVVSDLDLVKVVATEVLSVRTAGESAAPPLTISTDETLRRAAQMMAEHEMTHVVEHPRLDTLAARAMLCVVVDELIPESHLRGNERIASMSVLAGFGLMMFLDNVFG
jgi:CBS domain-containing protein